MTGVQTCALPILIENGTEPGNYTLRVKLDGSDISRSIEVFEKPFLKINKTKTDALVYTNCDGCRILIIGPNMTNASKSYTISVPGRYNVVLMQARNIISSQNVTITGPIKKIPLSARVSILIFILPKLRLF